MKKIDRNVVMLGWVSLFTDMASAMITPLLPVFVVTVLHEGVDKLGIIVAVATFVSYALRLLSGYLSDRYGIVKPLVVGGYALSALSKPLLGLAHHYQGVAALKAAERLGKGMRSAPKDLLLSHYSAHNASGKTFGFHKTMDITGELSGLLILFGILWYFGQSETVIRSIFYATLLPGVVGLLIVLFGVRDLPKAEQHPVLSFHLTDRDKHAISSLLFYFLFLFFLFNDAFFTIQAEQTGIKVMYIPLLFALSAAVQTVSSYRFGLLIDGAGARKVLAFAYGCGVAAQGLLALQTPLFTWMAFAFLGLFTVASLNANRAFISQYADNRGVVYGVFYAGIALSGALGAYVSGMVWEHLGMQTALLLSFGGTLLVSLLFLPGKHHD